MNYEFVWMYLKDLLEVKKRKLEMEVHISTPYPIDSLARLFHFVLVADSPRPIQWQDVLRQRLLFPSCWIIPLTSAKCNH